MQLSLKTHESDWALIGSHYEGVKLFLQRSAQPQSSSQVLSGLRNALRVKHSSPNE